MDIQHRHIEVFRAVMTAGSVTGAAALLHTSQPTLSRDLARLEQLLGYALFERERGRLKATARARALFDEVERSFQGLARVIERAQALGRSEDAELSLLSLPALSHALLPGALRQLLATSPSARVSITPAEPPLLDAWISEQRFLHALNYCMLLPGPEAQQLATYIGWLMHRTWGGIVAGGLFVLPSLFILVALSWIYLAFGKLSVVAGLFYGLKPAVTALVVHAAHRIGTRALKNGWLWGIAAAAFVAIFALDAPFPLIVLGAGLIGHFGSKRAPQVFVLGGGHGAAQKSYGPALIDDDTPAPPHARFSRGRLARVLAIGLGLWAAAMAGLVLAQGWQGALAQMGWFFTKAALLTFGGAYAVLPYVYQGAVEQHQWLSGAQMIDGLALGETTPGPLIMVVAFVGFVGGWTRQLFGPDALFLAGAAAASVVTFFTFLPSFVFILAGGPVIESTHGKLQFTAPLTAITAAVVGVILNLAMFFAWHVLWPRGWGGRFDGVSALITVGAGIALFRFKLGVMPLLGLCAALGLITAGLSGP